jgi:nucleotide-binding universal stress UspA family protein
MAAEQLAHSALERTAAALSTPAPVKQVLEMGDAGHTIVQVAKDLAVDVVVVGSRGRGAIRRALMGSVSTHIVNHAPCPVIVVRAGE